MNVTVQALLDGTSNPLPYTYAGGSYLDQHQSGFGVGGRWDNGRADRDELTGATAVSFGGTPATSFTVNSSTQITAVTPAHSAGTVTVKVTTAGGTSNGVAFTYVAVPTLTAIVPEHGPGHRGDRGCADRHRT